MVTEGWLTRADRAGVRFPAPQTARPATGLSGQRGYLVQAVEEYLTDHGIVDEKTLAGGGFRITTTLEPAKQDALVQAVEERVMTRLDPTRVPADRYVRVGAAAVDPANGKVLAMYGGVDYTRQYVNNATRRDYQVGSTFKPFVFTAAVQSGSQTQHGETITPHTLYDGSNRRPVEGWNGSPYDPANEDDENYGQIPVGTATDLSVNAVYAQMAVDVGPGHVRRTAIALGLPGSTPDLTASPSIALGPATASVLDMATAYATLAAHGRHGTYTLVERITRDDQELTAPAGETRQAVSREAADTTTAILRSVVEVGSGTAAQAAGRPAAGKTGTAEDDKAAWFAGYTPELATVVALMGQDPETGRQESLYGALGQTRINGSGPPAEIWARFTGEALAGTAPRDFDLRLMPGATEMPPVPPFPEGPEGPGGTDAATGTDGVDGRDGRDGRDGADRIEEAVRANKTGRPDAPGERTGPTRPAHPTGPKGPTGPTRPTRPARPRRDPGRKRRARRARERPPQPRSAPFPPRSVTRGRLEPHHGDQEQTDEEDPGGGRRLPEHHHAEHRRTGRADTHPHAVRGTDGQGLGGLREKHHGGDDPRAGEHTGPEPREAVGVLHPDRPADFQQTRDDKKNPGHDDDTSARRNNRGASSCRNPGTARLVGCPQASKERRKALVTVVTRAFRGSHRHRPRIHGYR